MPQRKPQTRNVKQCQEMSASVANPRREISAHPPKPSHSLWRSLACRESHSCRTRAWSTQHRGAGSVPGRSSRLGGSPAGQSTRHRHREPFDNRWALCWPFRWTRSVRYPYNLHVASRVPVSVALYTFPSSFPVYVFAKRIARCLPAPYTYSHLVVRTITLHCLCGSEWRPAARTRRKELGSTPGASLCNEGDLPLVPVAVPQRPLPLRRSRHVAQAGDRDVGRSPGRIRQQ